MPEAREEQLTSSQWYVVRTGRVDAVTLPSGSIRFRVQIGDLGREPFITQWFNDIAPAEDFLERVKEENEAIVRKQLKEERNG